MYTFPDHVTSTTLCSWLRARVPSATPEAVAAQLLGYDLRDPAPLAQGLELFAQTAAPFAIRWMMVLLTHTTAQSALWREVVTRELTAHLGRLGDLNTETMRQTLPMWTGLGAGRAPLYEALVERMRVEEEDALRAAELVRALS